MLRLAGGPYNYRINQFMNSAIVDPIGRKQKQHAAGLWLPMSVKGGLVCGD